MIVRRTDADNLNTVAIPNADGPDARLENHRATAPAEVTVMFDGLVEALVCQIKMAPAVAGCVAWLTHPDVLDALASPEMVSLLVQKEDFLRPDHVEMASVRKKYSRLRASDRLLWGGTMVEYLSTGFDPTLHAVRCVGVRSNTRLSPRMHHKFMTFCRFEDEHDGGYWGRVIHPYAVWTGSFNPTVNGERSRENAVLIESCEVARAYLDEWAQLVALSEPLDWNSQYIEPEFRIGT